MSGAEIFTICVVQNEADVIGACIDRAAEFSQRLWVWDLGSSDRTWEVLQERRSGVVEVARRTDLSALGVKDVRIQMLDAVRSEIPDGAWLYRLDADEFIVGDPRPLLAASAQQGAELVSGWHLNFRPTREDLRLLDQLGEAEWERIPLSDRLRAYQVGFSHWRFLRVDPELQWTVKDERSRVSHASGRKPRRAREKFLMRHYQYRSPRQVALRFETRQRRRAAQGLEASHGEFWYERTEDFRNAAAPASRCRRWEGGDASLSVQASDVLRFRARRTLNRLRKLPRDLGAKLRPATRHA